MLRSLPALLALLALLILLLKALPPCEGWGSALPPPPVRALRYCHPHTPVVDHLLKPHALVEHPHDDETKLIARGELLERVVPAHADDRPVVPFQGLVERQVATASRILLALDFFAGGAVEAKDLFDMGPASVKGRADDIDAPTSSISPSKVHSLHRTQSSLDRCSMRCI